MRWCDCVCVCVCVRVCACRTSSVERWCIVILHGYKSLSDCWDRCSSSLVRRAHTQQKQKHKQKYKGERREREREGEGEGERASATEGKTDTEGRAGWRRRPGARVERESAREREKNERKGRRRTIVKTARRTSVFIRCNDASVASLFVPLAFAAAVLAAARAAPSTPASPAPPAPRPWNVPCALLSC